MTVFGATKGDIGDYVDVGLTGIDNIAGAAVTAKVRKNATVVELEGSVLSAATPCSVRLQLGDTAAEPWLPTQTGGDDVWRLKTTLEFGGGATRLTFPEGHAYDELRLGEQYA